MRFKENPKFLECVELSKKADELLGTKEHYTAKEKALLQFRKLVFDRRKELKTEKKKLQDDLAKLQSRSQVAGINFCCIAGHDFQIVEFVQIFSIARLKYCKACGAFRADGNVLCGNIKKFARYDNNAMQEKVSKALKDENLKGNKNYVRLKKEAEEFVKINQQIDKLNKWLSDIQEEFEELCLLFGHDCVRIDEYDTVTEPMCAANDEYIERRREYFLNGKFRCRCCQKEMNTEEYKASYRKAKYLGGIIRQYYGDSIYFLKYFNGWMFGR